MRSSFKAVAALAAFIFIVNTSGLAATMPRISHVVDSRQMSAVRGSVHPLARPEFDQGALDNSQMLHRITLFFSRTAAQEQALDELLKQQQDPGSANYHQWLTPEQFGERFGLADADLAKVKDWLTSQGFRIDEVSRSRSYIAFSGSVGQVSSALQTEFHQYSVNGEIHFANATNVAVPSAMRDVVAGFRALNDFRPKPRLREVKPSLTSSLSGNHFLTPDDFASIYNLKALYASGIDGTGQKIAVMGQTNITLSDIATFRTQSGLPASVPQVVVPPGATTTTSSGDVTEASLDIEWAGAVAPKAQVVYVNSADVFSSMTYAISSQVAPVISISYGLCEPDEVNSTFFTADNNMLIQASAQGQTVVGPSGDDGAADCDFTPSGGATVNIATHGLAVDFPASSPNVTGVGGTAFNEGNGTYWFTANNSNNGSAMFYMPEIGWNDTPASVAANQGLSGTGGGVSIHYPKPTWQTGTGVPADGFRDVPDISFNASPGHDGYIICASGSCQICAAGDANCTTPGVSPGFRKSSTDPNINQTFNVAGGTSAGVPAFAGVVALINQKMGTSQGNVNPTLYQLANSAAGAYIFHDIPPGSDNKVPCQGGTPDCPSGGGSIGYVTGTGYDQVTGLGSVDAYNLVTNWNATPTADFGVRFFNSTISLAKGNSVTIPIVLQKQNGFNGTVNLACSSAMAGVTCSLSQASATPDAAVTVTITASASASLQAPPSPRPFMPWWESAFGVAAFFGMANKGKRGKRQIILLALLSVALLVLLAGCGGGGGSRTTTTSGGSGGTTTGTSGTVTVTATSASNASLSHSSQITVTVN